MEVQTFSTPATPRQEINVADYYSTTLPGSQPKIKTQLAEQVTEQRNLLTSLFPKQDFFESPQYSSMLINDSILAPVELEDEKQHSELDDSVYGSDMDETESLQLLYSSGLTTEACDMALEGSYFRPEFDVYDALENFLHDHPVLQEPAGTFENLLLLVQNIFTKEICDNLQLWWHTLPAHLKHVASLVMNEPSYVFAVQMLFSRPSDSEKGLSAASLPGSIFIVQQEAGSPPPLAMKALTTLPSAISLPGSVFIAHPEGGSLSSAGTPLRTSLASSSNPDTSEGALKMSTKEFLENYGNGKDLLATKRSFLGNRTNFKPGEEFFLYHGVRENSKTTPAALAHSFLTRGPSISRAKGRGYLIRDRGIYLSNSKEYAVGWLAMNFVTNKAKVSWEDVLELSIVKGVIYVVRFSPLDLMMPMSSSIPLGSPFSARVHDSVTSPSTSTAPNPTPSSTASATTSPPSSVFIPRQEGSTPTTSSSIGTTIPSIPGSAYIALLAQEPATYYSFLDQNDNTLNEWVRKCTMRDDDYYALSIQDSDCDRFPYSAMTKPDIVIAPMPRKGNSSLLMEPEIPSRPSKWRVPPKKILYFTNTSERGLRHFPRQDVIILN